MKKVFVGIVGFGTVGGGVVDILERERKRIRGAGVDLVLKTICVKGKPKKRGLAIPKTATFTENLKDIYEDDQISIVVEVISDVKVGGEIIAESLRRGKHVVSANKAALADRYDAVAKLLSKNTDLRVGIEAAVAGGIPVIGPLTSHIVSDPVTGISGILNGTTNFIITKMEAEGLKYEAVLKEAQVLGYAEADPRADVDGYDARSKLTLLMQLAFGIHPNKKIATTGISRISDIDFEYANMLGATIRCLSVAKRDRNKVSAFVSPCIVSKDSNFAAIRGATNAVSFDSEYLDNTFLVGQGAGRYPTAVSVVADVVRIARGEGYNIVGKKSDKVTFTEDFAGRFYIRLSIADGLGIVEKIGQICRKNKVSIDAILQLPVGDSKQLPFVITTNTSSFGNINQVATELSKSSFVTEKPFVMPLISNDPSST